MEKILKPEEAELGKWIDSAEYSPEEMFPVVCCGFMSQSNSGTAEYEIFVAQDNPDKGGMVELNTQKNVNVAYWMYIPEAPNLECY